MCSVIYIINLIFCRKIEEEKNNLYVGVLEGGCFSVILIPSMHSPLDLEYKFCTIWGVHQDLDLIWEIDTYVDVHRTFDVKRSSYNVGV